MKKGEKIEVGFPHGAIGVLDLKRIISYLVKKGDILNNLQEIFLGNDIYKLDDSKDDFLEELEIVEVVLTKDGNNKFKLDDGLNAENYKKECDKFKAEAKRLEEESKRREANRRQTISPFDLANLGMVLSYGNVKVDVYSDYLDIAKRMRVQMNPKYFDYEDGITEMLRRRFLLGLKNFNRDDLVDRDKAKFLKRIIKKSEENVSTLLRNAVLRNFTASAKLNDANNLFDFRQEGIKLAGAIVGEEEKAFTGYGFIYLAFLAAGLDSREIFLDGIR